MRIGEGFPYEPLDKSRRNHIIRVCGGDQLTAKGIGRFLKEVGRPALGPRLSVQNLLLHLLNQRSEMALHGYDINAARGFSLGVLLYAGITREVNQIDHIPADNLVLQQIVGRGARDFAQECAARIDIAHADFLDLARAAGSVLLGPSYTESETPVLATSMGAGAVDLLIKETLDHEALLRMTGSRRNLELTHPFMSVETAAELEAQFTAPTGPDA